MVALGHETADTDVIPAGMEAAGDHVQGEPLAPERITGPAGLPLEPMATQAVAEGQTTWDSDDGVVFGTPVSFEREEPTAPESMSDCPDEPVPTTKQVVEGQTRSESELS